MNHDRRDRVPDLLDRLVYLVRLPELSLPVEVVSTEGVIQQNYRKTYYLGSCNSQSNNNTSLGNWIRSFRRGLGAVSGPGTAQARRG